MLDRRADRRAAAAERARQSRARHKAGLHDFKIRAHARRLAAAMRLANSNLPADFGFDPADIEAELTAIVLAFICRWIGK